MDKSCQERQTTITNVDVVTDNEFEHRYEDLSQPNDEDCFKIGHAFVSGPTASHVSVCLSRLDARCNCAGYLIHSFERTFAEINMPTSSDGQPIGARFVIFFGLATL
jgi:hypothetical protein